MKLSELIAHKKNNQSLSLGQVAILASSGVPKKIRDNWTYEKMKKNEKFFKSTKYEATAWQMDYIENAMGVELDTTLSYAEAQLIVIDDLFEKEPDEQVEAYIRNQIVEREEKAKQRYLERANPKTENSSNFEKEDLSYVNSLPRKNQSFSKLLDLTLDEYPPF